MRLRCTSSPIRITQPGFGLIEQIVVLVVLAILAAIAVPAFHHLLDGHALRAAQADYIAALQHARSVAVNEQRKIIFCPSRDARTCNNDGVWTDGWMMDYDLGEGDVDSVPLHVGDRSLQRLDIYGSGNKKSLYFNPDGSAGNSFQTLYFCPRTAGIHPLTVTISRQGRVRGEQVDAAAVCEVP